MNQDGTLGFMLQGVSQQPERVQPEGHVKLQRNLLPDPNRGLISRPGTTENAIFSAVPEGGSNTTVLLAGELYFIATSAGAISVYGYDGTEWTIADPDTLVGYFGNNCAAYATNGEIFVVNRDTVVATETPTFDGIYNWGYAYALGGLFSRTYTLRLRYSDGTTAIGTYTTPDGTGVGDADDATGTNIMAEIITSLQAHINYKAGNTTIQVSQGYASIRVTTFTFTLVADDGENNLTLRAGVSAANTFADVPKYAQHGAVIRIVGAVGTFADDVWLRFFSDTPGATVGSNFGLPGVWRETFDPDSRLGFDLDTMPHKLVPNYGTSTFTIAHGDWESRRVGNNDSNETPSFVGGTISDIGEFQSRLWFLSRGNFITSRTNERADFWRESAVNLLSSDPVDLSTAGEEESDLTWGVPYDKNLVIFSSGGQFFVDGETSFTPSNASIVRTTKFEMSKNAKPVVAGDTVMFPYKSRLFSGVNELRPSSELLSNRVDSLNKVTPRYIRGEIIGMSSAGNAKIMLVHTDAVGYENALWVYNFLWDNESKVQSAWHEWYMPEDVAHVYVSEGVVYLWTRAPFGLRLSELRPDIPEDDVGFHACMDFKQMVESDDVLLTRNDYKFVAASDEGDYEIGRVVTPASVVAEGDDFRYTFSEGAPVDLLAGVVFSTELIPNKPIAKDWRGNKKIGARIVLHKYVVDYTDSGEILAYMDNIYRSNDRIFVLGSGVFPLDDSPEDTFGTTISTGSFDVPWGEDASLASIVLVSNSVQPVTYVEIRWYGQVYVGKR